MKTDGDLNQATLRELEKLGGATFVGQMIDVFFEHVPGQLARMRGEGAEAVAEIEQAAHSVKSSARAVGADALQQVAERLESLAREGRASELPALVREAEAAYARVVVLLTGERKRVEAG